MVFHRIKKYSRQIVCYDMVLSCQFNHIEEIPLLKRAQISAPLLQNQKVVSSLNKGEAYSSTLEGGERSTRAERDFDLSDMLMSWHLWNIRSVFLGSVKGKTENQRRSVSNKHARSRRLSLTLRNRGLYMAIEKYLLFLMSREVKSKKTIYLLDNSLSSHRDRVRFSAFYIDTALGLRQYLLENARLLVNKGGTKEFDLNSAFLGLSLEKIRFPFNNNKDIQPALKVPSFSQNDVSRSQSLPTFILQSFQGINQTQDLLSLPSKTTQLENKIDVIPCPPKTLDLLQSRIQKDRSLFNRGFMKKNLSLHCPSLLLSPDMQDVAQSGLITLEGSLTLEVT